jgi:predicted deacetylase
MAVHVSIHDVSPVWLDEVEEALELCDAFAVRPALLVIPNFHGRASVLEHQGFCERLRGLQALGHEVYLHGFFHESRSAPDDRYPGGRLAWLLSQRIVSHSEAEMSELSPDEGRERLDEGERMLQAAGLHIDGFVPPAWSMPAWLLPMLATRGCRFTEDHFRVYDPARSLARASVVLNWASRSPARLVSTVAWCRAARHARSLMPARIAIHPADMRHPLLRREIASTLAWARSDTVERGVDLFY